MPIITFYSSCKQETANTVSAIVYATYLGITKNKKTLLVSTSLNDDTVKDSLWPVQQKRRSGLFGPNTSEISQNGMEELDRVMKSNRVSPELITNYTRVALTGRLEALAGYNGNYEQYKDIQKNFATIISLANKAYDTIIVDLDQNLDIQTQIEIIKVSDIIVATTTQKISNIEKLIQTIEEGSLLNKSNTVILLGRYDNKSKYNAKNISRNLIRQKEIVNTIPYNPLILEATQEGKIIETLWTLTKLKNKDENYFVVEELNRLDESIGNKILKIQMKNS